MMKQQLSNLLPGLRRFAFSLTGNMADADDLVQMTLEKALKQQPMSDMELQKWTFRVCRNLWIDEYRSQKVRQQATQKPELQQPEVNEEQQQLDALTLHKVGNAMQHLNSEQRSVISLVAVQGMAYKDVAQTLDVPVGTVMSRLARARVQLAELLGLSSQGATQMKIDDQVLSAFLDAELSEQQMQIVRERIAEDERLCDRLAELAAVDQQLKQFAQQIDEQPLPGSISSLLASDVQNNVVSITATKRRPVKILGSLAVAASAVFAITLTFMQPGDNKYQVLAATPSGVEASYADGSIIPQLSFANQQGQLCRVYLHKQNQQTSQNLACRNHQGWIEKTAPIAVQDNQQSYQTASASNPLDLLLDEMMVGSALNAEQEQQAIATNWQSQ